MPQVARDLRAQDDAGVVVPSPDDDDRPVSVDLRGGRVTIRR